MIIFKILDIHNSNSKRNFELLCIIFLPFILSCHISEKKNYIFGQQFKFKITEVNVCPSENNRY